MHPSSCGSVARNLRLVWRDRKRGRQLIAFAGRRSTRWDPVRDQAHFRRVLEIPALKATVTERRCVFAEYLSRTSVSNVQRCNAPMRGIAVARRLQRLCNDTMLWCRYPKARVRSQTRALQYRRDHQGSCAIRLTICDALVVVQFELKRHDFVLSIFPDNTTVIHA